MAWLRIEERDRSGRPMDVLEYCETCSTVILRDTGLGREGRFEWGSRLVTTFTPQSSDECTNCERGPDPMGTTEPTVRT